MARRNRLGSCVSSFQGVVQGGAHSMAVASAFSATCYKPLITATRLVRSAYCVVSMYAVVSEPPRFLFCGGRCQKDWKDNVAEKNEKRRKK